MIIKMTGFVIGKNCEIYLENILEIQRGQSHLLSDYQNCLVRVDRVQPVQIDSHNQFDNKITL